jgi:hypothetical protein
MYLMGSQVDLGATKQSQIARVDTQFCQEGRYCTGTDMTAFAL